MALSSRLSTAQEREAPAARSRRSLLVAAAAAGGALATPAIVRPEPAAAAAAQLGVVNNTTTATTIRSTPGNRGCTGTGRSGRARGCRGGSIGVLGQNHALNLVIAVLAGVLAVPAGLLPVWGVLVPIGWPIVVPIPEVLAALLVLPAAAVAGGLLLSRPLPEWAARRDAGISSMVVRPSGASGSVNGRRSFATGRATMGTDSSRFAPWHG
jgi:hypothetical protein